jgi:hypothetical protein
MNSNEAGRIVLEGWNALPGRIQEANGLIWWNTAWNDHVG